MGLKFAGITIPGICYEPRRGPPELDVVRTKYKGLAGVQQIISPAGGRPIEYGVWLFSSTFTSVAKVRQFIDKLNSWVGEVGRLEETGANPGTWDNCCFHGYWEEMDIKPIIGVGMEGNFWTAGKVQFYQLLVD